MLLVITGPACAGKMTLAKTVLEKTKDASMIKVVTTKQNCGSRYRNVSDSEFSKLAQDPEFINMPSDDGFRYGVSKQVLRYATMDVDAIIVMVCSYSETVALAKQAPKLNTASVCAYLHCRPMELMQRLTTKQVKEKLSADTCYQYVQDIYDDHNTHYSRLEDMSVESNGFTAVLPVNTGKSKIDFYFDIVVDPLMEILDSFSVYKNMRKLRNLKHNLGVAKYAN